mmetsp:Transcript_36065/g.78013  ORF Transcript_36065/g.78013 Transcript_36065/m.78013 type:complete len:228 (+) Transcript_36065:389-1072(+)
MAACPSQSPAKHRAEVTSPRGWGLSTLPLGGDAGKPSIMAPCIGSNDTNSANVGGLSTLRLSAAAKKGQSGLPMQEGLLHHLAQKVQVYHINSTSMKWCMLLNMSLVWSIVVIATPPKKELSSPFARVLWRAHDFSMAVRADSFYSDRRTSLGSMSYDIFTIQVQQWFLLDLKIRACPRRQVQSRGQCCKHLVSWREKTQRCELIQSGALETHDDHRRRQPGRSASP